MSATVAISSITIGNRHRRDMGDLRALANSIAEVGLLHPIGMLPNVVQADAREGDRGRPGRLGDASSLPSRRRALRGARHGYGPTLRRLRSRRSRPTATTCRSDGRAAGLHARPRAPPAARAHVRGRRRALGDPGRARAAAPTRQDRRSHRARLCRGARGRGRSSDQGPPRRRPGHDHPVRARLPGDQTGHVGRHPRLCVREVVATTEVEVAGNGGLAELFGQLEPAPRLFVIRAN